ncbi:MAG: hypothetical protein JWM78_2493 [Verrucomicrobiaceae bacterium]|nr:hypothetical protein [Verrucomicrobiaceae bacterium]
MEQSHHIFSDLFAQLGLPNSDDAIRQFCAEHSLDDHIRLPDAEFWTPAQAQFLRDSWRQDADWAEVIDQLNASLHRT